MSYCLLTRPREEELTRPTATMPNLADVVSCRNASAGPERDMFMQLLKGHISHLKPDLAVQVAVHLLQRAEEVLVKPALLPQHVSLAIQELAALQCTSAQEPTTCVGQATPIRVKAEPQLEVPMPFLDIKRQGRQPSCQGSSILGMPKPKSPEIVNLPMTEKPSALRMTVSTPTPSNGANEWGDDNFSPSSNKTPGPPKPHSHVPKALRIGKRHSEPIPILGPGADQCGTPSIQHGSKRRAKQDNSCGYTLSLRASTPETLIEGDSEEPELVIDPASPTFQPSPAPQIPYPAHMPSPTAHVQHSGDSHSSDNTSDDDEDVGKAVARALRHHLPSMPELAQAITKLMMHEGMCSQQDLLRVAAGGRPSVLDTIAAAAINNAMDCQMWLENMPSDSPSTSFDNRHQARSCNSAQQRFPARSKSAATGVHAEQASTLDGVKGGECGANNVCSQHLHQPGNVDSFCKGYVQSRPGPAGCKGDARKSGAGCR